MCGPAHYAYDLESATNALLVPIWDILDRGTYPFILAEYPRATQTSTCSAMKLGDAILLSLQAFDSRSCAKTMDWIM